MEICSEPMRSSQVEGVGDGALIKDMNRDRLQMIEYNKKIAETETKQTHREKSTVEGKIIGKEQEYEMLEENKIIGSMGQEETSRKGNEGGLKTNKRDGRGNEEEPKHKSQRKEMEVSSKRKGNKGNATQ